MYLPHAVRQMPRPDRMISISDFRKAVELGELVEDYSEDAPGHRCLILAMASTEHQYTRFALLKPITWRFSPHIFPVPKSGNQT